MLPNRSASAAEFRLHCRCAEFCESSTSTEQDATCDQHSYQPFGKLARIVARGSRQRSTRGQPDAIRHTCFLSLAGFWSCRRRLGTPEQYRDRREALRLGVTEDHAALAVPKLIGLFRRIHPDVDVDIQTGMTLRMRHELGDRFDIVVAAQPLDSGGGEVLRQERLVWLSKDGWAPRDEGPLPLAVYPDGCL